MSVCVCVGCVCTSYFPYKRAVTVALMQNGTEPLVGPRHLAIWCLISGRLPRNSLVRSLTSL